MKITRHKNNPIINPKDVKPSRKDFSVIGAFNCGVTLYKDMFYLLIRVAETYHSNEEGIKGVPMYSLEEEKIVVKTFDIKDLNIDFSDPRFVKTKNELYLTSISHLRLAKSYDGIHFIIDDKPFMTANHWYESYGIEDPRITQIEDVFYINYSAISRSGVVTCLAITKDFVEVEKQGIIFLPDNKDVVIFPEKINNQYYVLNRPVSSYFNKPEIWLAKSDDLKGFKDHEMIVSLREGSFDSSRIGASCVPYKTEIGWLEIYHGATSNNVYSVGVLLLDLNDPSKILYQSDKPLIEPIESYEKEGFMPNVIFPCGFVKKEELIYLYYGNCDENICLATFSLKALLNDIKAKMKLV